MTSVTFFGTCENYVNTIECYITILIKMNNRAIYVDVYVFIYTYMQTTYLRFLKYFKNL